MKITLCLIVWNELQGCQVDVPKLPFDAFDEVIAVDSGSTDGTVEYLERRGIPVHRQPKPGLNAAYVHANKMASGDAVVVFFPKGTLPTDDLLKIRPLFEAGNELIVASRQIRGAANEEDAHLFRPRKWAVRALATLATVVWRRDGYFVRDVLHGFKGWTKTAFSQVKVLDHGLSIPASRGPPGSSNAAPRTGSRWWTSGFVEGLPEGRHAVHIHEVASCRRYLSARRR